MLRIETPRLLLRDYLEEDWTAVHEWASDPEVVRDLPWGPNSEEQTKAYVKEVLACTEEKPRIHHVLGIVLQGRRIGGIRLTIQNLAHGEADLGYVLHRAQWGKGIATEAARAMLRYGFGELKLHRIYATCRPSNLASARVLEKIGMRREGLLREQRFEKGRWVDSLIYAMLDRDFNAIA